MIDPTIAKGIAEGKRLQAEAIREFAAKINWTHVLAAGALAFTAVSAWVFAA